MITAEEVMQYMVCIFNVFGRHKQEYSLWIIKSITWNKVLPFTITATWINIIIMLQIHWQIRGKTVQFWMQLYENYGFLFIDPWLCQNKRCWFVYVTLFDISDIFLQLITKTMRGRWLYALRLDNLKHKNPEMIELLRNGAFPINHTGNTFLKSSCQYGTQADNKWWSY